jgi:hypothetical protein
VIDPVLLPLQSTLVVELADTVKALGSVIVTDTELVHPFASLIPIVWVPAANELKVFTEA